MMPLSPNVFLVLMVLSCSMTIFLLVCCVVVFLKLRRREKDVTISSSKASSESGELSLHVELLERLPRFNVEQSYADIYRGRWRATEVCVKLFNHTMIHSLLKERSLLEMQLLNHENIVQFYFADVIPGVGEMLVFKHYAQGDLEQFLKRTKEIGFKTAVEMCLSILKGIDFLHSSFRTSTYFKPGIIHGDLSPKNILLNNDLKCVLTDFGNSVMSNEGFINEKVKFGTNRYISPEFLNSTVEILCFENLCQCEIYSFSLISWEILICVTGLGEKYLRPPVFSDVVKANPTQEEVLKVVVTRNQRPAIPNTWVICFPEGVELLQKAWSSENSERPSSLKLIESFQILESFY